jgi:hypothetical protein
VRAHADRGGATVLLMVAVVLGGATALAAGRAGTTVAGRQRATTVAESVITSVAADRVRGIDPATARARGRALARRNGATVIDMVEVGDRIEVRVARDGAVGSARVRLEW